MKNLVNCPQIEWTISHCRRFLVIGEIRSRCRAVLVSNKAGYIFSCVVLAVLLVAFASNNLSTSSQNSETTELTKETDIPVKELLPVSSKRLTVPYVEQGDTSWCFEASLCMVLQYHGKEITAADIAASLGEQKSDSISFLDMFLGLVDSYLSGWPELSAQHYLGNWDFTHYVDIIDEGIPIVVSTFGFPGHTLVVVGYSKETDGQYLYVNDPSGYFSKLRWGKKSVRNVKISWPLFSRSNWTHLVLRSFDLTDRNSAN